MKKKKNNLYNPIHLLKPKWKPVVPTEFYIYDKLSNTYLAASNQGSAVPVDSFSWVVDINDAATFEVKTKISDFIYVFQIKTNPLNATFVGRPLWFNNNAGSGNRNYWYASTQPSDTQIKIEKINNKIYFNSQQVVDGVLRYMSKTTRSSIQAASGSGLEFSTTDLQIIEV